MEEYKYLKAGIVSGIQWILVLTISITLSTHVTLAQSCAGAIGLDSDLDGVDDFCDLDDDNDGILDLNEQTCIDPQYERYNATINSPYQYAQYVSFMAGSPTPNNSGNEPIGVFAAGDDIEENYTFTRWFGQMYIPSTGSYSFSTSSDDWSFFVVNGTLVVDNGGNHGTQFQSGSISLSQGWHSFELAHGEYGGVASLTFNGDNNIIYSANSSCTDADNDNDNTPDRLDTDSDNDGCPDAEEGSGNFTISAGDIVNGRLQGGVNPSNGLPSILMGSTQELGESRDSILLPCSCPNAPDFDSDSVADRCDLDDDNDGIPDVIEDGCQDPTYERFSGTIGSPYQYGTYTSYMSTNPFPTNTDNITIGTLPSSDNIEDDNTFYRWYGVLNIPSTGSYTFSTNSDDWSFFTIDGSLVVNNPGAHPAVLVTNTVVLNAGLHDFELSFGELGGGAVLEFTGDSNISYFSSNGCLDADFDNDGIVNSRDLDSDNDGCPDAIEGGDLLSSSDVDSMGVLNGTVDLVTGIADNVNQSGGQAIGNSQDSLNGISSIICPDDLILSCDQLGLQDSIDAWLSSVDTTTNCVTLTLSNDYNSSNFAGCNGTGSQLISFIAQDKFGNSFECQATLTIDDSIAPTGNPPNQSGLSECSSNALSQYPFNASQVASSYSDNCGDVNVNLVSSSLSGDNGGWTITYNYNVTDDCGNTLPQSMTITGVDQTDPVAVCQNVTAVLDNTGMITINPMAFYEAKARSEEDIEYFDKQANWVCDCEKRVPITIVGSDTILSNYQVKINVPNYPEINSSYSNIQFTSSNQTTSIDHWTQTYNASQGVVWVEIPSIPTTGTTIYLYYGGCGSAGNPDDVFEYWNDFDSLTGAINNTNGGAISETFQGASVLTKVTNCDPDGVYFNMGLTIDNFTMVVRETRHSGGPTGCTLNRYGPENSSRNGYSIRRTGTSGNDFGFERRSNQNGGGYISTGVSPAIPQDTFVITEFNRCSDSDQNSAGLFRSDGSFVSSVSGSINNHNYSNFSRFVVRGGRDYRVDYVALAKRACTPPTYSFGLPIDDGPEAICANVAIALSMAGNVTVADDVVDNGSSDNCDISLTYSLSKTSFNCNDLGDNTVTMTVTDDHGNSDQCTAIITIIDNIDPSITCASDTTVSTGPSACEVTGLILDAPVTTDNCSVSSVTNDAPAVYPLGTTTVTWTVTDGSGNMNTCEQRITVVDNIIPSVSCPDSISVAAGASCFATGVDLSAFTASDNCDTLVITNNAPDSFPLGITTVTWTVADTSGNVAICNQIIEVTDTELPNIVCPANDTLSANSSCSVTSVMLEEPAFEDNCSIATITNDAPTTFPIGITTVTWTVTDSSGNSATCMQLVVVIDDTNPSITCPSDVTVSADVGSCAATSVSLGSASISDNCAGVTASNDAPASFPVGTTMVTWTVTDASGNSAICIQNVTVTDNENPTISCPGAITMDADSGQCSVASVSLGTPTTSDNCPGQTVSNNAPSSFPVGTTTVTWTVTDASGNEATCTQDVTIEDYELPSITCPPAITLTTDPGSCTVTNPTIGTAVGLDNCNVDTIYNNAPAVFNVGDTTVIWTVIDEVGNMQTCEQEITVVDNQVPSISCPGNLTINVDPGSCEATGVSLGSATLADNCGIGNLTVSTNAPASFDVGNTTVTWTVADEAGNQNTCTQVVTVVDNEKPSLTCPADVSLECTESIDTSNTGVPIIMDNCGIDTIFYQDSIISGLCISNYIIYRKWTATDNVGNDSICIQVITVVDTEAPVLATPSNLSAISCDADFPVHEDLTATDDCSMLDIVKDTLDYTVNICAGYTVTYRWIATDACSNADTAMVSFAVLPDTEAPVLATPSILSAISCDADFPVHEDLTATDDCSMLDIVKDTLDYTVNICAGYTVTYRWIATDACSNADTAMVSFAVLPDTEAPVLATPSSISAISCDADFPVHEDLTATDDCSMLDIAKDTLDYTVNICAGYTVTYRWIATDACSNADTAMVSFAVLPDTEAPVLATPSILSAISCDADFPVHEDLTATDDCSMLDIAKDTLDYTVNICAGYTVTYRWIATDACSNADTAMVSFAVLPDTEAPVLETPSILSAISCDADFPVHEDLTATDDCSMLDIAKDTLDYTVNICAGYTVTYRWIATDACSNADTAMVSFAVLPDTEAPVLATPSSISAISCDADFPVHEDLTATDDCSMLDIAKDTLDYTVNICAGYTVTYRWIATDACSNADTAMVSFAVLPDTEAPVLATPSSISAISCDADFPVHEDLTATDDCSMLDIAKDTLDYTVNICAGYTVTYRWIATDACSNSDTAMVSFAVLPDTEAPVLATPSNLSAISCDADFPVHEDLTATDDCSMLDIVKDTLDYTVNICAGYTVTYRWIATDACSNADTAMVSFAVLPDTEAPVLATPSSISAISCDADFPVHEDLTATDDCSMLDIVKDTLDYTVNICAGYTVTYRWIATDACSNADTAMVSFAVLPDTEAPVLATPSILSAISCDADFPVHEDLTATDDCSMLDIVKDTLDYTVNICAGYTVTYRWIATDACSNADTAMVSFAVLPDTEAPVLATPSSISAISCDADFPVHEDLTATDDCSMLDIVKDTLDYTVNICAGYTVTYRWIATDACSNADTAMVSFAVLPDTEAPVLATPSSISAISCDADFPVHEDLTATDDCSMLDIVKDTLDYTVNICAGYTVTYRWIATDACSNADTAMVSFAVLPDTEAPVLATPSILSAISCDADFPVHEDLTATDDCSMLDIVKDTLDYTVNICAGYTVTYRWIATDACSNADTAMVSFAVLPDTEAPVLATPSILSAISCDADFPVHEDLTATDDCSMLDIAKDTLDYTVNICAGYTVTYRWIATDACSNADTAMVSFAVLPDTEAPVLATPSILSAISCDADFPVHEDLTATDDCSMLDIAKDTLDYTVNICAGYTVTYRWIATDACSNADTAMVSFAVLPDTEAPVLATPSSISAISCDADFPVHEDLTATDDCSMLDIAKDTLDYTVNICAGYTVTYRWIATDACSNADTAMVSFAVLPDTEAPVLATPSSISAISCDADFPVHEDLTATDDCSMLDIAKDTLDYTVNICAGYTVTYRWIATDACSNSDTAMVSFAVLPDTEAPVLATPSSISAISCDADFPVHEDLTATDDCSMLDIVKDTLDYTVNICAGYTVTYRWIATDACSNADTAMVSFAVLPDTEAPVLETPSSISAISCDADFPVHEDLTATDDCSMLDIVKDTLDYTVNICAGYTVTYRWIATDACSNADTAMVSFAVLPDTEAPVLATPSILSAISCDADFPVHEDLTATDDCSMLDIVKDTLDYTVNICAGYTVTYRWIATDACSNADTAMVSFAVLPDTEAPVLATPSNLSAISCDADFPVHEDLTATDDCSMLDIVKDTLDYTVNICAGYTVTYRWIATDACSNADTAMVSFAVLPDTEAPVLATPSSISAISCDADFPVHEDLTATDDCSMLDIVKDTLDYTVNICAGYTVTYRWIATDACSNADTAMVSFAVLPDTEAPVLATPSILSAISCDADFPVHEDLTATDDCSMLDIVKDTLDYTVNICAGYTVTYRWIATDACSNADTAMVSFAVLPDTEAPVLATPSSISAISCDADFPVHEDLTATDDCSMLDIVKDTLDYTVNICAGYTVTYRWIATDACSNADTAMVSFAVLPDTEAPVLETPSSISAISCDADFPVHEDLTATDDCSMLDIVKDTLDYTVNICAGYTVTYRWIATDACSNTDTAMVSFAVLPDTEAPVLATPSILSAISCDADFPVHEDLTATDDCSMLDIVKDTLDYTVNICAGYTVTYRWIATDACSNADTAMVSFAVLPDTEAPVLATPSSISAISCDADFPVHEDLTATDDCSMLDIVKDTLDYTVNICAGYTVTYRWIATDACSNADTAMVSFAVLPDTEAPVLETPSSISAISCDADFPVHEDLTATDDCSMLDIVKDTLDYTVNICAGYTVTYRWIATDACSNADTAMVSFAVLPDTEAPVLATPSILSAISCDADFPVHEDLTATDDCSMLDIVKDTLDYTVNICAGYTVTYRWIATDACSNADTAMVSFAVLPDTEAPVLATPSNLSAISCDADFPVHEDLTATDDCSMLDIVKDTLDYTVNICAGYTVTYRWIATDACSNADTAMVSFAVLPDTEAPVLATPSSISAISCDADFPVHEDLTATDDCSMLDIVKDTLDYTVNICAGYTVTYRWIATDACSNADTAMVSFAVLPDTEAPVLATPSSISAISCDADFPVHEDLTATDDCSMLDIVKDTLDYTVNICAGYTVTYRWIATDACSNADTAMVSFAVLPDTEAPVLATPSSISAISCDADFPVHEDLTATDDCSMLDIVKDTLDYTVNICAGYTVTYRWIATDACSNADTAMVSFAVLPDTEAPVLATPSILSAISCDADFPVHEDLTATDDCSMLDIVKDTLDYTVNICAGYTVTYRWIATDACSNADTAMVSFAVLPDTEAPVLATPSSISAISCDADFPVHEDLTATDDCSMLDIVKDTLDYTVNICAGYTVTYRWIATDACSNADTAMVSFAVLSDTEAPVLSNVPEDYTNECSAIIYPGNPSVSDLCDGNISMIRDSMIITSSCMTNYIIRYIWTAKDNCDNISIDSTDLTIEDTTAPVISNVPTDVIVYCEADIPGHSSDVMVGDNCDNYAVLSYSQINNDVELDTQIIVNKWIATDCSGNMSIDSQVVTYIVKLPSIELSKYSIIQKEVPAAGDTILYTFEIKNTGNATLFNSDLIDDKLDYIECSLDSIPSDYTYYCSGWTLLTQTDIDTGFVCNSAVIQAQTSDGIMTIDTSDSGNVNDDTGLDSDKTYTYPNQVDSIELIKTTSGTVDNNNNGVVDLGDYINYHFVVKNIGNVTLRNITITDSIVSVTGALPILLPGQSDSTSFSAQYEIDIEDVQNGFVENSAIVNALTPASMLGHIASDVSDNGDPNVDEGDAEGLLDGNPTNDPVVTCVLSPLIAPINVQVSACLSEEEIIEAFKDWTEAFGGGGCGYEGRFNDTLNVPELCGGQIEAEFLVYSGAGQAVPGMSVTRTFQIIADSDAPTLNSSLPNLTLSIDECQVAAYQSISELETYTGLDVNDACTIDEELSLTYEDQVIPAQCGQGEGYMSTRVVNRIYSINDKCGNTSEFTQSISLLFSGCNQLTDFGEIGFNEGSIINVPTGCVPPEIEELSPIEGACDFVEHMWLMSTEEIKPGQPFFPNTFNIGTIWFVIDKEVAKSFQPGEINQNTYFVRCSRDISCCDFGESNLVAILIDEDAECPEDLEPIVDEDCLDQIILTAPTDDMLISGSEVYRTNNSAEADIKINNGAGLTIDAKGGVLLKPNFEVGKGAQLEIKLDGCDN